MNQTITPYELSNEIKNYQSVHNGSISDELQKQASEQQAAITHTGGKKHKKSSKKHKKSSKKHKKSSKKHKKSSKKYKKSSKKYKKNSKKHKKSKIGGGYTESKTVPLVSTSHSLYSENMSKDIQTLNKYSNMAASGDNYN